MQILKANEKVKCTQCFKSLGVSSRMNIYQYLVHEGEASVSELVSLLNLKQPTVSYHLKEMRENGLLDSRKDGKEVIYSANEVCPHYSANCVVHDIKFPEKN